MTTRFAESFPGEAPRVAAAPGRVNLIGEHTDYNDGFVLPMAIARSARGGLPARGRDGVLRAHSIAYGETKEAATGSLAAPGGQDWFSYVAGVVWAFAAEGLPVCGMDVVVDGDVPIGAGLSSSAALEMATARALAAAAGAPWEPARMAKLGQRAENALRRHELRDHGPVRLGGLRERQRPAARLPLARDAGGAGAARRRGGGDGHGRPPLARGERVQRAPRGLRAGGGRDRADASPE